MSCADGGHMTHFRPPRSKFYWIAFDSCGLANSAISKTKWMIPREGRRAEWGMHEVPAQIAQRVTIIWAQIYNKLRNLLSLLPNISLPSRFLSPLWPTRSRMYSALQQLAPRSNRRLYTANVQRLSRCQSEWRSLCLHFIAVTSVNMRLSTSGNSPVSGAFQGFSLIRN